MRFLFIELDSTQFLAYWVTHVGSGETATVLSPASTSIAVPFVKEERGDGIVKPVRYKRRFRLYNIDCRVQIAEPVSGKGEIRIRLD